MTNLFHFKDKIMLKQDFTKREQYSDFLFSSTKKLYESNMYLVSQR